MCFWLGHLTVQTQNDRAPAVIGSLVHDSETTICCHMQCLSLNGLKQWCSASDLWARSRP